MKKQLWSILVVLCLVAMAAPCAPENAREMQTPPARLTDATQLLQFTSGGHVVGFTTETAYVAGGSHAYRVEFVKATSAEPIADSGPSDTGRIAPLSRVTYPNLWAGITLTYDAPAGAILRSAYRLEPYADPAAIRLHYNVPAQIDSNGNLGLAYATGVMRESAPIAWQEIGSGRVPVQVAFTIYNPQSPAGDQGVGFALGAYDPAYPLFIDPLLTWNTFLGGSGHDEVNSIAVDGNGNVYVAGYSDAAWQGTNPPVRAYSAGSDTFAAKLDSSGALIWNTFLGGSGGEGEGAIAVDGSGNIYVTGGGDATWGSPVSAYTAGYDAFVVKLNSSGGLIWNTFLGGSGFDYDSAIAVDGSGNAYVAGYSNAAWQGTNPPVRAYTAGEDAFTAKLDSSGGLTWSTFLGGSGIDEGHGIAVDGNGNIYLGGGSNAAWGLPVRAYTASGDAFTARLDSSGALTWNTFLGGSGLDDSWTIAVDGSGNVYVEGRSNATWQGTNPPVRAYTAGSDAFAVKLDSGGALTWNTFLGGSEIDDSYAIAVDGSGNVYVAGDSNAAWGSPVRAYTAGFDAFTVKLNSNGGLTWNTFLGGSGADSGYAIAVDGSGNVYAAGLSNATWSSPVRAHTAGSDAFVVKLSPYYFLFLPLVLR